MPSKSAKRHDTTAWVPQCVLFYDVDQTILLSKENHKLIVSKQKKFPMVSAVCSPAFLIVSSRFTYLGKNSVGKFLNSRNPQATYELVVAKSLIIRISRCKFKTFMAALWVNVPCPLFDAIYFAWYIYSWRNGERIYEGNNSWMLANHLKYSLLQPRRAAYFSSYYHCCLCPKKNPNNLVLAIWSRSRHVGTNQNQKNNIP